MNGLANRTSARPVDASAIQGDGYDVANRTFTIGDGTYAVRVDGLLPRSMPLRLERGLRVEATYTPSQGGKISFTLDHDSRSFRLPLRPGGGSLRLIGTPIPPSTQCLVKLESRT